MIAFAFRFPAGRYHATPWGRHANEADTAWPPEPARILRALIATWWRKADRERFPKPMLDGLVDALAAELPVYRLPPAVHTHIRAFMPAPTEKKLIFDAFLRFDRRAEMIVAWSGVTLTPEQRALAAHLLARIGYLGRAESWTEARIADDWDGEVNACARSRTDQAAFDSVPADVAASLTPVEWDERRATLMADLDDMPKGKRQALAATLPEHLADALAVDSGQWQQAGWSSPPPMRQIVYDRPAVGPLPTHQPRRAPIKRGQPGKPEAARFLLAGRPPPRIEDTLRIAEIARLALIRREEGVDTPRELLGRDGHGPLRDDPEHAHAFYLPEDADGDGLIDHLIVYCRLGFSAEARRRLDRLSRLWLAHGRADEEGERGRKEWRLALEDIAAPSAFPTSAVLATARAWRSATPYLKARFDKRRPNSFAALIESYRIQITSEWRRRFPGIGLPDIQPITDPGNADRFATTLGQSGRTCSTLAFTRTRSRKRASQPDACGGFFELAFEEPVSGPVAIGWGCHFGLGLFAISSC